MILFWKCKTPSFKENKELLTVFDLVLIFSKIDLQYMSAVWASIKLLILSVFAQHRALSSNKGRSLLWRETTEL